jgi:5-methylcytosine-specific restriction protein A
MREISKEMIHKAFDVAKDIFLIQINRQDGIKILSELGMKESSANDYVYCYSNLLQGKLFTRTINAYGLEYYLQRILEENGNNGLKNALLSLSQHIDYYEAASGASVKKGSEIYAKFFSLIKDINTSIVFPDEVPPEIDYSEGKTKKVLVNSYERNLIARQKCIEYFGFNCHVCDVNFCEKYGKLGNEFIHVHHKVDISTIGKEYSVDPIEDLIPVCPNCHAMLHKKKPAYTVAELQDIMTNII